MSKEANAGELRTSVCFVYVEKNTDAEGVTACSEVDVFGCPIRCKWANAHGTEIFAAMQQSIQEPATITCRYSPRIQNNQLVYKAGDPIPYEIISIDNVEERNRWLEIKVKRRGAAR